jgi:predicted 3-demethylubiquinone-9 3-methyltransferase (glyoxalase superfamily)
MTDITPCLWFDGQAEEAVNFYLGIFPNSRIVDVLRCGEAGPGPVGSALMFKFELDGRPLLALNGGPQYKFTPAVSLSIYCDSQAEVDRYWAMLSDGGQEVQCGWVTDRYGLSWQVVPRVLPLLLNDPDPAKADRAMRSMMGMVKLDIAELERATRG